MKQMIMISILIISIFLVGCAKEVEVPPGVPEKEVVEERPPAVPEVVYETSEEFVNAFIDLWKAENFDKLYPMFVSSLTKKLPKEKFVYLFSQDFKDIKSIKQTYYDERDAATKFSVLVKFEDGSSKRVSLLEVIEKKGVWQMNDLEQYFDVLEYCDTTLKTDVCVRAYAKEFNEADLCKYAGTLFKSCYDSLDVDLTVSQLKEICTRYTKTVASEAECYKVLAYEDNNDYYCSVIQVAKKKYLCYGNIAEKSGAGIANCEVMKYEASLSERTKSFAYCVAGYVEKTGEVDKCDLIIVSDVYSEQGKELCLSYG